MAFIQDILANPALLVTVILTIGVILVNGWTDAPNAIATCISTRAIKPRQAILMAAFFNFLGVFLMTMVNKSVAMTISNMVDFGTDIRASSIALSGALASIVIWATAAWYFGIPTSESHALIAGLTGAAVAYYNSFQGVNGAEWVKVIFGLILSTVGGFALGWGITRLIEAIFRHQDRRKTNKFFKNAQIVTGMGLALSHGANDSQKSMGIITLGLLVSGSISRFEVPSWTVLVCAGVIAVGAASGAWRLVRRLGAGFYKVRPVHGFCTQVASAGVVLTAALLGGPVSTTQVVSSAIMGVGSAERLKKVRWGVAGNIATAWLLTIPATALLAALVYTLISRL